MGRLSLYCSVSFSSCGRQAHQLRLAGYRAFGLWLWWHTALVAPWHVESSQFLVFSLVTQSCLTLCDLMDCRLPGFSIHGIFQVRVLEWVAISFSRGSSQPRDRTWVSHIVGRCFTVWARARIKYMSPALAGKFWTTGPSGKSWTV